jgi:pyruvate/2-oxoglutarate dehydrogenase complex dihydrolipoamide acyltransferase (E2) component
MTTLEVRVPDLGGSKDVPAIELLAKVGDVVAKDQGLVTLESDKATMEIPSPAAGTLREWRIKVGDAVSRAR